MVDGSRWQQDVAFWHPQSAKLVESTFTHPVTETNLSSSCFVFLAFVAFGRPSALSPLARFSIPELVQPIVRVGLVEVSHLVGEISQRVSLHQASGGSASSTSSESLTILTLSNSEPDCLCLKAFVGLPSIAVVGASFRSSEL